MDGELEIDLRDYLKVLGKWKWLIVGITALAALTSGLLSWFVLPQVYETKAVLMVTQEEKRTVARSNENLQDVVNTVSRLPEMTINTYVNQVKSQVLFQRVIERLKLDKDLYSPGALAGMVNARGGKDTNLIEISVQNTDATLAANVANALSEEFLKYAQENKQEQLGKSVELLQQQATSTDKELAAAADRLKNFDTQPRSVDYLNQKMQSSLADLNKFRSQTAQVQVEINQLQAGRPYLEEQLKRTALTVLINIDAPPSAADPGQAAFQKIVREEPNPAYAKLRELIDTREVSLAEKKAQLDALQAAVADLEKGIEGLQAEIANKQAERERLQRDVERLKAAYSVLAQKITETRIARSINIGDTSLQMVASAVAPVSPIKPNKKMNVALALILGLMTSVFLAFLLEFLNNTLETADDIRRYLGLPVLGSIPLMSTAVSSAPAAPISALSAPELPAVGGTACHLVSEAGSEVASAGQSE